MIRKSLICEIVVFLLRLMAFVDVKNLFFSDKNSSEFM